MGLNLISCGFASFSFHASLTKLSHWLNVSAIPPIMLYLGIYSVLNVFLEDLNRL